jgi:hypothetical protein
MRITTRVVYQMTPDGMDELERASYQWDGPVALAGGGDSGSSDTVSKPWKKLQPYVLDSAAALQSAAQAPNQYYGGDTVADFTPWQQQGQQGAYDWATGGQTNQTINNQLGAVNAGMTGAGIDPNRNSALGMTGGMYDQFSNYGNDPALQNSMGIAGQANQAVADPYSDPTLAPWIAAAQRPVTQNYQENVLPGIADQAEMYGGAGSRTGLREGQADRAYMDTMGDISSGMYNNAYNTNINRQMQAGQLVGNTYGQAGQLQQGAAGQYGQNYGQGLSATTQMTSLAPGAVASSATPWQTISGVGGQQQAQNQAEIGGQVAAYDYNRDADWNRQQQYYATLAGTPWGSGSSSDGGTGPSAIEGAAGGAMMGGALAGAQAGGVTGPWGAAIGAGVGAAYSIWG